MAYLMVRVVVPEITPCRYLYSIYRALLFTRMGMRFSTSFPLDFTNWKLRYCKNVVESNPMNYKLSPFPYRSFSRKLEETKTRAMEYELFPVKTIFAGFLVNYTRYR